MGVISVNNRVNVMSIRPGDVVFWRRSRRESGSHLVPVIVLGTMDTRIRIAVPIDGGQAYARLMVSSDCIEATKQHAPPMSMA